ncbi:MAG TPA: ubiquinol-cytochrome c reductase iron-sulfur subunit [Mycobacteriales bacterium]|jgi:ubiquinol-cytochrome c reductase iron-sulfur subunit|nr:ubiquinol-cytochrome c reductase iron-sulfur subunit [Mycobacteriales bacterium]
MSTGHNTPDTDFDVDAPNVTQFDLVREGARRDGVEIVHYAPRFPVPGTKAERRIERRIAALLILAGLASLAFVVVYIAWPFHYELGANRAKWFTPLLGSTLGLSLFAVGAAIIIWGKKLMPEEVAVQDRHDGASPEDERKLTAATLLSAYEETGLRRRPLLKGALALGTAPIGLAIGAPFIGSMIKDPGNALFETGWGKGTHLVRHDGTKIRPADMKPGAIETVFPGIPGGATNRHADSPTLLIHLREDEAEKAIANTRAGREDWHQGNFFAFSKICTHAGCPASLYEQQTNRLLCPCHQSQFDVLDACRPVFGPATRSLPQLAIALDADGYFVSQRDYTMAVGPAFWERP